ncbi:hypothetical protein ANANG_G00313530 [Anguilla anguilla]|uniref:PHD-type domain-containing protein n=1 Tax=Anguilla anguilla TaxID=7936 RepID=A0A9D3RK18_ANGAN|nr:hypothetical protein ANANG_G00313530 [Anguilla anguilla]
MLGTLTSVPLKVPQVSSLHRLAIQAPTVLPQVRPKTLIPDSLPHSPSQEQALRPPGLQRVTAVVSPRTGGPALPTPNSTAGPLQQPLANGQPEPVSASISSAGVAYAIISASSAAASEAVKVQPLLLSADSKVIIIQPQAPGSSHASPQPQPNSPVRDATPPLPPSSLQPKRRERRTLSLPVHCSPHAPRSVRRLTAFPVHSSASENSSAFMVALGLVTTEHLEEIQSKRQERKRRSTANPAYSGLFEPERKRLASHYLSSPMFLSARDTEDLCWKEDSEREEICAVCKEDGELQPCHSCARAYHPDCLQPPLKTPPKGPWMCPKCQKKVLNKDLSWPQSFIQSYMTHKTVREEEKRRLMRRNGELKEEWAALDEQDARLSHAITECMELKESLLGRQRDTQASLERLKALVRLIQRDQVIQVTMTATTTTGASLLSLPWIKPAGASASPPAATAPLLQKSVPHTQGNN